MLLKMQQWKEASDALSYTEIKSWVLEKWHKVINIYAVGIIFFVCISELKRGTKKYIPGSYRLRIIYIN